ncbi:MAG: glycine--tRNA ligase subunit beta [Proteobacteria bacterium]|nr:glycine--tRNA ligase subunit beta [Pseudomonadota bacterium]
MSKELLLEIGTEEMPAGFLSPALEGMKKLISSELESQRIQFDTVITMGTPRRLVLCVKGMAERQTDTVIKAMGPPEKIAFDSEGNPTKAAKGFASRQGVSLSDLKVVETKKGNYLQVKKELEGKATLSLLPDILVKIMTAIPFPKSMRWGDSEVRFARPIKWILALFNGKIVSFSFDTIESSNKSWGHRFLSNKPFIVQDLQSYLQLTEKNSVISEIEKRKEIIQKEARRLAKEVGGKILKDEELLDTVANLVEYPVIGRGSFSQDFLELPRDVLICSMKEHQKYFAVANTDDGILPYFIVVMNNQVPNPEVVVKGNERVLSARLTDARFFFDEDRKIPLSDRVAGLKQVVHQAKLGSIYDKVSRLKKLGESLARELKGDVEKVQQAAFLCKADLLTEMVGEFPTLQGIVGREYALLEGENPEVAEAIYEHYLPLSGKGELPSSLTASLLSIADKVDTIVGCFGIGLIPTGTADPHALRRQALGIINIILGKSFHMDLPGIIEQSIKLFNTRLTGNLNEVKNKVSEFIQTRFHHQMTSREYDYDVVEAATTAHFVDLVDVFDRINTLQKAKTRPDFQPLAITFKRVANIIASHPHEKVRPLLFVEEAEKNLYEIYQQVETAVQQLIKSRDYPVALNQLAMLKPSVDRFFDDVMVMCEDESLRINRLGLLGKISILFKNIADFSKIVTEEKS